MIDVVLLGCGATMPTPERGVSAAALRYAGRYILFDCGEGTQVALRRAKVSLTKIDLIALTHYHGDHILGLPGLLQTMNCLKRTDPLHIMGPDGLEEVMEPILKLAGQLDFEVRPVKIQHPAGMGLETIQPKWTAGWIHKYPTAHRVPSQGYKFTLIRPPKFLPERAIQLGVPVSYWRQIAQENPAMPVQIEGKILAPGGRVVRGRDFLGRPRKGISVAFTGDTQPSPDIILDIKYADLLIHDATYGDDDQASEAALWGHSTFRQAAEMAAAAEVKELWFTHYSQSMANPEDYLSNAQGVFRDTVCGYDGFSITLRFDDKK